MPNYLAEFQEEMEEDRMMQEKLWKSIAEGTQLKIDMTDIYKR